MIIIIINGNDYFEWRFTIFAGALYIVKRKMLSVVSIVMMRLNSIKLNM